MTAGDPPDPDPDDTDYGALPVITSDQLQQLQTKVARLVADKGDADGKTRASNDADAKAAAANAAAAQARLDEQAADAKATADLSDLQAFIDGLAAPAPAAPPSAPAATPAA